MIRLIKLTVPNILSVNSTTWTSELMNLINSNQPVPPAIANRYNHPQIKSQVKAETFDKCCYCESKVTQVYPGDIEHLIPKSKFPRLTYTWKNMTFSCSICNNRKRDYLNKPNPLLNPYKDNPSQHLRAFGPFISQINGDTRGEITVKKLDLNRADLRERRTDILKSLSRLLDKFHKEQDQGLKQILKDELLECAETKNEYSLTIKQFLIDNGIV